MEGKLLAALMLSLLLISSLTVLPIMSISASDGTFNVVLGGAVAALAKARGTSEQHYWGSGCWAAVLGQKFEMYIDPTLPPFNALGTFTIDDISSISYHTNKPGSQNDADFYLVIYTKPDGVDDKATWYGYKLIGEPYYSRNLNAPSNQWNKWSTDVGANQLTFFDPDTIGFYGFYGQPTLQDIQAGPINWNNYYSGCPVTNIDYGVETVKYISFQTGTAWMNVFQGYIDAITIALNDGTTVTVDLEGFASEIWVDDDWTGLPPGYEVEPGKFIGYNAFSKIQDAVIASISGGVIYVYEGTYTVSSTIIIDKTLTLLGPQADVDPRPIYGGRTGPEAIIEGDGIISNVIKIAANNVVINGFTIRTGKGDIIRQDGPNTGTVVKYNIIHDGRGDEGIQLAKCTNGIIEYNYVYDIATPGDAISFADSNYCIIRFNEVYNIGSENAAIYVYGSNNMAIVGNIVHNVTLNDGIKLGSKNGADAGKAGGLIKGNIIYDVEQDGISVYTSHVVVEENEIYNCRSENGAIYIAFAVSNITVRYNNIHDNNLKTSKRQTSAGILIENRVNVSTVTLNYNNIYNNKPYGCTNEATGLLDARFNWWGDASGPTHASNSGGMGDKISDNVDYSPWLGNPFEIMPRIYHVNPTGAPGAIQEAIDAASPFDTVIVHEGTYAEQVMINKSLILHGLAGAKILAPDVRSPVTIPESTAIFDPVIFAYGSLSGAGTIDVTIEGFEVDGGNKASSSYRYVGILCRNVKPGAISNNVIHSLYPPSGKGSGPQTFGLLVYGDSDVTIQHNEIKDFSRGGIGVSGDAGPSADPYALVQQNTVFGNGLETETNWWAENGIQIAYGAKAHVVGNEVFDCMVNNPSWASTGILVVDTADTVVENNYVEGCDIGIGAVDFPSAYGPPWNYHILSDVLITGNTLVGNTWQIDISNDARNVSVTYNDIINAIEDGIDVWSYFGDVFPTNITIHYNNITGSGSYGVWASEDIPEPVDARYNWWGHETGPLHETSWIYMGSPYGPHFGLGDKVSDYVLYVPWISVVHDVAVIDVSFLPTSLVAGETVTINVTVENQGSDFESFTVTVYYDNTPIESQDVINLFPGFNITLTFYWNTPLELPRGVYIIKAEASIVLEEIDIQDNTFTDGTVEILWHDVAIVEISPSRDWVYQGHNLNINVTVLNKGDFLEEITVTLYYNITAGQTIGAQIITLPPGESATLTFVWDTTDVEYCHNYQIVVTATITAPDNDPLDNTLTDGSVKVRILGDVNGDETVDMADISIMIDAFFSYAGHPLWNPDLDVYIDDSVDMADIGILISNFLLSCQ
ncbi:MAG: right-handed parallel beta-helix repeat-containing protein [Candidatus Bathyarchaeia archaeon]